MTGLTHRTIVLVIVLLVGTAFLDSAKAAIPGTVYPGQISRPCLVPPVPPKKGPPPAIGGPIRLVPAGPRERGRLVPKDVTPGPDGVARLRVIAIRVDFADQPLDSTAAYFERLLLFLKQYYGGISDGQLELQTTLAPNVYRMPHDMKYYGLDDSVGVRETILAWDAVKTADPDIDFSQYDRLVVFHGGAGQESDANDDSHDQIWSVYFRQLDFANWLPYGNPHRGIATADRWAGGDTVFVESVAIFPETESQDGWCFSSIGVVCHEFGHGLGLPDMYDTTAPDNKIYAESQGIGSWDLMSSGTWNDNGFVPGELSAWSKVFLGWIKPQVISSDSVVSLTAIELDRRHGVVKVPLSGDEYFLIENRQEDPNQDGHFNFDWSGSTVLCRTCGTSIVCRPDFYKDSYAGAEWDYFLPGWSGKGSGLLIWHIDDSVLDENLEYNTINSDPSHKGIDLEEADAIQDMDTPPADTLAFGSPADTWRAGNADRFGPDTEPNTDAYYGIHSGVTIDQISPSAPTMSFRISFAGGHDGWPVITAGPIGSNAVGVADVTGDGARDIVVADRLGDLYVLNPDGSPAWTGGPGKAFRALNTAIGPPLLADVDGDGRTDLLVAADDGRVFGFRGGTGEPMGERGDGVLLTVPVPAPGAELYAVDLTPTAPGVVFGIGGGPGSGGNDSTSAIRFYSVNSAGVAVLRGTAWVRGGAAPCPGVMISSSPHDTGPARELIVSVRRGAPGSLRGGVEMHPVVLNGTGFDESGFSRAPLPDTVFYSAPVAGDIDRDGRMDVVVTSSDGLIYALTPDPGGGGLKVMPGWPRLIYASGNDQVSLADIDGNGYLEVLVLETGGVLHVFNYHGDSLVGLPELLPSETRYFIEPQLAPLVTDLTGDGHPELVLPLRDGQVFAVRADGSRLTPGYLGGGRHGSAPAVEDLDGNGTIELVTASNYLDGGQIDVRPLGRAAGPPAWGTYRRTGLRDGTMPTDEESPVVNGPFLADTFVMPNPARQSARIHYRVGLGVDRVSLEIVDLLGRDIRRLEGPSFAGTDNTVEWDLTGRDGRPVAPGVYMVRIEATGSGNARLELLKFAVIK